MLLADEPEVLLETVRSRCQEVALRPIPERGGGAGAPTPRRRGQPGDGGRNVEQRLRCLGVGGRRR